MCPCLLIWVKCEACVKQLIQSLKGCEQVAVRASCAKVCTKERGELVQAVKTAAVNQGKQLGGGKRKARWLYGA